MTKIPGMSKVPRGVKAVVKRSEKAERARAKAAKEVLDGTSLASVRDDQIGLVDDVVVHREGGKTIVEVNPDGWAKKGADKLNDLAREVVKHAGGAKQAQGYVKAARDLAERRLDSPSGASIKVLQERYRDALQADAKAKGKLKLANDNVKRLEAAVARQERHAVSKADQVEVRQELVDAIVERDDRKESADNAKRNLKVARDTFVAFEE